MDEEDILSSVAEIFEIPEGKQNECKSGLFFLELLAATGYELPAKVITDLLRPVDTTECTWILTTAVALDLGNATRLLTKAGASVTLQNKNGEGPLHIAVKKNKSGLVRALVESGLISPDEPDGEGELPVKLAARYGSAGSLRVLLQCGATVNSPSEDDSALHLCVRRGDLECLLLLLAQEGVDLDVKNWHLCTPLMNAVEEGNIECVQSLLRAGADTKENRGAAHIAAFKNRSDILKLLIDAGVPFEEVLRSVRFGTSMTPLHVASAAHALDCLMLLIALGSDVNAKMKDGITPLHMCLECEGSIECLFAITPEDKDWYDEILRKVEFPPMLLDCVRALIAAGAAVNACDKNLVTPLHLCALNRNVECLRILLDAGANAGSVSSKGLTSLHYAAMCPSPETLRILLETGVPVDHTCAKGKTALHAAASVDDMGKIGEVLDCMKILVNAGANIQARTSRGQTPLWFLKHVAQGGYSMEEDKKEILRQCVILLGGEWDDFLQDASVYVEEIDYEDYDGDDKCLIS